jgi:hypothetical protein
MPGEVKLTPNIPLQLALQDPAGIPDQFTVHFPLSDGRTLTLPRKTAIELNVMDLRPGEPFMICKDAEQGKPATYRVWLPPETEKARAAEEIEAAEPDPNQPREPVQIEHRGRRLRKPSKHEDQPRLFDRGTGTYGPATMPLPQALTAQIRASGPVPMDKAFRECVAFVTKALKDAGEQWTDAAKQDAVSTCIISAAKKGWLSMWERP